MNYTNDTLFTIGYEGLSQEKFLALLIENGVDTVVDVREVPFSRKPGFSKNALAELLREAGLQYVHIRSLGCPKTVRNGYKEDGDWQRYTEGFLQHLSTQGNAIAELSERAHASKCALLCYEADYNFCHRAMVANAVRAIGTHGIHHITANSKPSPNLDLF